MTSVSTMLNLERLGKGPLTNDSEAIEFLRALAEHRARGADLDAALDAHLTPRREITDEALERMFRGLL